MGSYKRTFIYGLCHMVDVLGISTGLVCRSMVSLHLGKNGIAWCRHGVVL